MRTTTFSATEFIPDPVRRFLVKRASELSGAALLAGGGSLTLALVSWSVQDPSLNHAIDGPIRNFLGSPGAIAADLAMQMLGLATIAALTPIMLWGWRLVAHGRLERPRLRLILFLIGVTAASGLAALLPTTDRWPLPTGLGGVAGDA